MALVHDESSTSEGLQAHVLTAMAHPLRRRLVDLVDVDEAATASMLAEQTGQAVGNISHHLHVLARAGLIEEAPELARDKRERWWRLSASTIRWSAADAGDDPAARAVATAAEAINLDHQLALTRTWLTEREQYAEEWQRAAFATDSWMRLTPAELREFQEELTDFVIRWSERGKGAGEDDREKVFVFARAFPAQP
jgi:DNA-binding transcriptional ArsR family regulator